MSEYSDAEFRDYVGARLAQLRREAFALCGDWHEAEDLVQHSMEKLYPRWNRVRRGSGDVEDCSRRVDGYVRKTLHNKFLDERKSARWRHTDPTAAIPEDASPDALAHDEREPLLQALQQLPREQRSVIVLRYWIDMSVRDTAEMLGMSTPKVKTLASRGCAALAILMARDNEGVSDRWKGRTK